MAETLLFTGEVHSGRTTFLSGLVTAIRRKGISPQGFLSLGEGSDRRSGFLLEDLRDGSRIRLASRKKHSDWPAQGPYYFNPAALDKGRAILDRAMDEGSTLIVVDEVGPMELQDRGWGPCLDRLAGMEHGMQLWLTRNRVAAQVREKWKIPASRVLDADPAKTEYYLKLIEDYG